jgi:brefeldin A-inhibited guanine nucleotide-exchange protein
VISLNNFDKEEWHKSVAGALEITQDEPQTNEEMHPAVTETLEVFRVILSSQTKSAKACEAVLEGIHLLVANRYVSGRADGEDSFLHGVMESASKGSDLTVESVQVAFIKAFQTILTSPKCGVHESSMVLAFRSVFHVYLVGKSPAVKDAAKAALLDMLRSVMGRMEAYEAIRRANVTTEDGYENGGTEHIEEQDTSSTGGNSDFASQYHADAYALFRSLCKMTSKETEAENVEEITSTSIFASLSTPADPMSLHGKILSLELILAAIDLGENAFCEGERFVNLVQQYLCVSLLKNCVSNHTQVAYLSQNIFLQLVRKRGDA